MLFLITDGMKLESCDNENGLLSALCENHHVGFNEVRCSGGWTIDTPTPS